MFERWQLLLITAGYLCLLFLVAYLAEVRQRRGRSIAANPYVYSLSLAVYCTSWTYYGSVGKAATGGLSFLTIYLGPTLMALLWMVLLPKVIKIARDNRITTIADFIGSRYGNSLGISALVTIVATVGLTPYIGLQIKAIISTYSLLSEGHVSGGVEAGWMVTTVVALFAVIFGSRRGASDKHDGLVFAIAFESIVKLVAFIMVGLFVTYHLFDGYHDIFGRIARDGRYDNLVTLGAVDATHYMEWGSLMFLSMMAIMFLPRQFQVTVVENHDISHVRKAVWLFPLYLFAINIFVLPVAFGGLLSGAGTPDYFVLTLPMREGHNLLTLFVFIGGISAASSMIIVEALAISNMVMNNIVTPILYRLRRIKGLSILVDNLKSVIILGLVFIGYAFALSVGHVFPLVDLGLKSFEAVSIFAPAFLIGLYWKRGNAKGAIAGITGGFIVWCYTLLMPALMKSGVLDSSGAMAYIFNSEMLNPHALFGLTGMDKWSHSLFWGLLVNVGLYVGISIFTSPSAEGERQALLFVDSYSPTIESSSVSADEVERLLEQFLGPAESSYIVNSFLMRVGAERDTLGPGQMTMLRDEARRALSGAFGSTVASVALNEMLIHSDQERQELLSSIKQMGQTLMLSRRDLAATNRELELLKEFSENIIESLPLGVATLDLACRVTYWNAGMKGITGRSRAQAMGSNIFRIIPCLGPHEVREGEAECNIEGRKLKGFISSLTGGREGYVIVLEDITERKRIEDELFLATKHASIGRLAAGVSHEIGNPLASISSIVQELMQGDIEDVETVPMTETLETITHHIDRIARIVRNLGDFARLYPRQKVPASLEEALQSTLRLIRYDSNFRAIEIETDFGQVPAMQIDADQMQQVFLNLLLNARDAMPEGGKLNISISMPVPGEVSISFADSGRGVDEEVRDKIFDPFFTTKGPTKGTGLGLSVCYSIIRDHGGNIEVTGSESGGSNFTIKLPVSGQAGEE